MNRRWMAVAVMAMSLAGCRWPPFGDARTSKRPGKPTPPDTAEGSIAPAVTPQPAAPGSDLAPSPAGEGPLAVVEATPAPVRVPVGTALAVELRDAISSGSAQAGDGIVATLSENVVIKGKVVLRRGCELRGRVIESRRAGRTKGKGQIAIVIDKIIVGGRTHILKTAAFSRTARGSKNKDAKMIGGGAGTGALLGAIVGGKKGAAIGAGVGAGAGAGAAMSTRGEEAIFPAGQRLAVRLDATLVLD